MDNQEKFDSITLLGKSGPVEGQYYCLPWPSWGQPEQNHPGSPLLYDISKSVAEGGLPFRARWGVEHEGENLLAENSYTKDSEIKDGYPEITFGMLDALGFADELTAREKLVILAIGADRYRHDMLSLSEGEAGAALDRLEARVVRGNEGSGDQENVKESWGGADGGSQTPSLEELGSRYPDYPDAALDAIEAYLSANPQDKG
ncbi:hypothetical protein AB9K41_05440, partial [Cribrihabitans sp. XS_ASV171]